MQREKRRSVRVGHETSPLGEKRRLQRRRRARQRSSGTRAGGKHVKRRPNLIRRQRRRQQQKRANRQGPLRLRQQRGGGLVNTLINKLPVELHLPGGYRFCGPGTRLAERLARGDKPLNALDEACRAHDIAYSLSNDVTTRNRADRELRDRAAAIGSSPGASLSQRLLSKAVAGILNIKQSRKW